LSKASGGKFIETVVQIIQYLETGNYEASPSVDSFLKNIESKKTKVSDDLKICCSRIARSCYTIRNKRNVLHKGAVDPNIFDLKFMYNSSQWIMSEFVRQFIISNMQLAGKIVEFIQAPVGPIFEDIGGKRIVLEDFTIFEEIIVLLKSHYPDFVEKSKVYESLERRSRSAVIKNIKKLWVLKLIQQEGNKLKLTIKGYRESINIINKNIQGLE
jgi:hypothetical protein